MERLFPGDGKKLTIVSVGRRARSARPTFYRGACCAECVGTGFANKGASLRQKGNDAMKNRKTKRTVQSGTSLESDEAKGIRESIEELERELDELDRDIAEAKKGDKGEMSRVALANFRAMRKDIVVMIASNRELYKAVLESDELEHRIEEGA